MVNAHCADALICISNCDKITPGMLNAALRLNIPTVFVSGGPMEGGTAVLVDGTVRTRVNLITAIADAVADQVSDEDIAIIEESACPTCGSCSGMFTANSMNCLTEALGLALPGNGSTLATHTARKALYEAAGHAVVDITRRYYYDGRRVPAPARDRHPRGVRERDGAGRRDGRLDQHRAAPAGRRAGGRARVHDAGHRRDLAPRALPVQARAERHLPDGGRATARAASPRSSASCTAPGCSTRDVKTVHTDSFEQWLADWDIRSGSATDEALELFHAAPGCVRSATAFSQSERWETLDTDAAEGCIRDVEHAHSKDGGLAILYGNIAARRLRRQDGGRRRVDPEVLRPGAGRGVPGRGGGADPERRRARRRRDRHPLRRTEGRTGHAGDALSDVLPEGPRARQGVRADHRRAVQRRHERASRSATSRRRRRRVARLPSSRRATRSTSTSRTARSSWRSRTRSCRSAARRSPTTSRSAATGWSPPRCGRTPRWPPRPTAARCATSPSSRSACARRRRNGRLVRGLRHAVPALKPGPRRRPWLES